MARHYILYKGLRERIAERQAPPPVMPDRAKWQEDYVARSRSGTDIRSTSGEVGDTGVKQEQMNAMTPAERQARLRQIAAQPTVPHYHALPSGQIAWGHGGAGTTPLKPGDKLMAYRGIEKKPTELRVHSVNETHLGQGMRVIHPDKVHEDMHGPPLHPMHLASATHIAPPHPLPLARRPMLMKSAAGRRKNTARHKVVARHIRHSPALGREGRDRHGSDVWYHAGFLLAHDPEVARGCGLAPPAGGGDDGGDAAPSLAQSVPDGLIMLAKAWFNRRHISKPGSRGGRFYYDQHGEVVYGERPGLGHREAQVGDHALTANGHGRVAALGDGQMTVRHEGGAQDYGPGDIHELAPGHHQGDELSPRMVSRMPEDYPQGAGALRRRMIANPQPGDRAEIGDGGSPLTVHRVDDQEVGLKDDTGSLYRMPRTHWRRSLEEHARPLPPAPGARMVDPGDSVSPRALAADAMRQAMAQEPPASPTDTSADDPHRARLREALAHAPWVGDTIAVVKPLALDGNDYEAGKRYAVAYVEDGMAELLDGDGDPVATLSPDNWRDLLGQNAVVPLERGEMPDDDVEVPGEGVHGVFGGKVSRQEFKAAWEGTFAGYTTKADTLHEETGKAMLSGSIVAPNGETVGVFERHALRDGRGNVTIEHVVMEVQQDMKVGFADQFNAQAEATYQRWGVRQINVYADISVGKYCWAMQGYTFADPDEREGMVDRFATWCQAHGHTIPDNRLVQMQHPWDIAGYTDGPEVHVEGHPRTKGGTDYVVNGTFGIGKAFFLADPSRDPLGSGSWHGVKVLSDPDHPTMRQARRYRKGK